VAQPGQVVEVAGGTYPGQTITYDASKTSSAHVVIEPAPGATVTLSGRLQLGTFSGDGPRHLTIKDLHAVADDGVSLTGWQAGEGTQDVDWVNLDASNFYLRGVQHFHIIGGDWGPCEVPTQVADACGNNKIDYADPPYANNDITIDGARFHNLQCRSNHDCSGTDIHFECLYVAGGTNIVIRNSTFRDCEFYDILVTRISPSAAGNFNGLRIENNWLDTAWDGQQHQNRSYALSFAPWGTPFQDVLVRYNSLRAGIAMDENGDGTLYSNFRILGNIADGPDGCYPSVTYTANIWTRGSCGGGDVSLNGGPFPYVSETNFDFHLTGGVAVDLVPGTNADQQLATDIDGQARPMGAGYDAGSDELR
jgi:hypothetical protein